MEDLKKLERRVAMKFFRAGSYLKSLKLYDDNRAYLINELFSYYYYDIIHLQLLAEHDDEMAHKAATVKASALSKIVAYFERYNQYPHYHLAKIFGKDGTWKKYATKLVKTKRKRKDEKDE